MKQNQQRAFFIYQVVYLIFLLYLLLMPLLIAQIKPLAPGLWQCSYEIIYNKPCIFCGTTTHVYRALTAGILPPTYICISLGCMATEIIRKTILCIQYMRRPYFTRRCLIADVCLSFIAICIVAGCFILR